MAKVEPTVTVEAQSVLDAMHLAAASATTMAVMNVLIASSSGLSAALLAAPKHSANVYAAELAATGKTIDLILGSAGSTPPNTPSNKEKREMKKILRLLRRLVNENAGTPVVT